MGLLSIFQSKDHDTADKASSGSASDLADAVQRARARARHRLIGAAVLVMTGVIVFPLLFETRQRPVAVDIPIEIPRKETAAPLVMPERKPVNRSASVEQLPAESVAAMAEEPAREMPAPKAEALPASVPAKAAVQNPPAHPEPSRAEAAAEKSAKFVVQAGAFADIAAAKEVRAKVEKLGFKTFVQTTETSEGKRVRVRIGPFSSREEADKVLASVKAAGVSAAVLTP
jgi:DedD protein